MVYTALALLAWSAPLAQIDLDAAARIEEQVRQSRTALRHGRARVTVVNVIRHVPGEGGAGGVNRAPDVVNASDREARQRYDLYFKGDHFRFDDLGAEAVAILNETQFLWHGKGEGDANLAAEIKPREEGRTRVIDPRVLGIACAPFGTLAGRSLSDFLGRADRTASTVEEVVDDDGNELTLVQIERPRGARLRYWIDAARGWNVVRAESEAQAPRGQGALLDRLDCRLGRFGEVWFPEQVVFTRALEGRVLFEETCTLTGVDFDTEVPDEVFTLESMNLPAGTYLHETPQPSGQPRFWKSEEPRPAPAAIIPAAAPPDQPSRLRTWLIAGNLVLAAVLVGWYLRRRGRNSRG